MFSAATKTGSQPSQAANYIEDVFSTWLYTGNGSTQTITNGIDLAGEGGLTWIKQRNTLNGGSVSLNHYLIDTVRGGNKILSSNTTSAQSNQTNPSVIFNSNGFDLDDSAGAAVNYAGSPPATYASWTFRKQPKFFDVVTYTGNGVAGRTISHNLGSAPGMIIVKCTSASYSWFVYHRSVNGGTNPQNYYMLLNSTAAQDPASVVWNDTAPTSTEFTVGTAAGTNASGQTYVAYLFAHNAGGFGTSGTDNVISCGSVTASGGVLPDVNLGWEPQWLIMKNVTTGSTYWDMQDNMRGSTYGGNVQRLRANVPWAENADTTQYGFTSTGLNGASTSGFGNDTYIYMAIRRPMKVPTDATTVFKPVAYTGNGAAGQTLTGQSLPPDLSIFQYRSGVGGGAVGQFDDRLRGGSAYLAPSSTNAEGNTSGYYIRSFNMDGVTYGTSYVDYNYNGNNYVNWLFTRRPGFFDEVCYTGTGATNTQTHNLGVAPELIIFKDRSGTSNWNTLFDFTSTNLRRGYLNLTNAAPSLTYAGYGFLNSQPTSTSFILNSGAGANQAGVTSVAYLFATCPGVSKVGSYTGTGTLTTINCGFTGGARFVLIKRTDTTSDWFVWDTARGMVAGTDPSLSLNTTAAESNANSVYTATTGFQLLASPSADVNTSGGNYIYLAIA